jgi:hypothetical protein
VNAETRATLPEAIRISSVAKDFPVGDGVIRVLHGVDPLGRAYIPRWRIWFGQNHHDFHHCGHPFPN